MTARGFTSALATLRSDLEFEHAAVKLYAEYAKRIADPALKEMLRDFARAESGHVRGISAVIERLEGGVPAVFFCPVCGWELDLGIEPADGTPIVCPMCKVTFTLTLRDGDFVLEQPEA
jgi:rubrerythrin